MKKFFVLFVTAVIMLLTFTGCGEKDSIERVDTSRVYIYVDPETGVNYLLYHGGYAGGMTVRLDENGDVIVTK